MRAIDRECEGWDCEVGLVSTVLERMAPDPANTIAITCGPPIVIKYALISIEKLGFTREQTYTILERRMKCGIFICGRCNVGLKYICVDGPVFSMAGLKGLSNELWARLHAPVVRRGCPGADHDRRGSGKLLFVSFGGAEKRPLVSLRGRTSTAA